MRKNILNFDEELYIKRVKEHHIASGSFETGSSCAKVLELMRE